MPFVRVQPMGIEIEVVPGETVMAAATRQGYEWPTVCNGDGTCTVCWMSVLDGSESLSPISDEEETSLEQLPRLVRRSKLVRLACRARVIGDVEVEKRGVRQPGSGREKEES
jgi:2Fe-2S ferredoxin